MNGARVWFDMTTHALHVKYPNSKMQCPCSACARARLAAAERLAALLPELEYSRETHVQWRDCDQSHRDRNPEIGNAAFHAKCVREYTERIDAIRLAVAALRGMAV